jgi:predicted nucleic acid-binding protein
MATHVLDSWALIAFYKGEPAGEAVERLIESAADSGRPLLLSAVNWAEVYFAMARAGGRAVAEATAAELASLPIDLVGVGDDLKLARLAAQLKASPKLSLADAFAAALAKEKKAELVTGDPQFKAVEKEIKIHWLKEAK